MSELKQQEEKQMQDDDYGISDIWTSEKYKGAKSIGYAMGMIAKAKQIARISLWDFTAGPGIDDFGRRNVLLNVIDGLVEAGCQDRLKVVAIEKSRERHERLFEAVGHSGFGDFVETRCGMFSEVIKPGEIRGWGAVFFDPVPNKSAIKSTDSLVELSGGLDIISYWSMTNLKRLSMTPQEWLSKVSNGSRSNFLWSDPPVGVGSKNRFQWSWLWASNAKLNGPFGPIKRLNRSTNQKWLNTNRMQGVQLAFKF